MVSGYAITTLVLFILSIICVIRAVPIPTPRFLPKISLNLTTAPIITILTLWAAQCLNPTVIRNGIVGTEGVKPYNIIILFFSLAYMAITLDISGVLRAAAYWVSKRSGDNGWKLYLYFYVLLTVVSILLGNDPVISSGTAFLVYYTQVADLYPLAWVMAEFAAANTASMVLFVGNPTNVVICEGFSVNNAAFTAYTILPFVACNIFCFVVLAFQFRKQVPRKLAHTTHRDPWKALRDPVAACVGSFMLGTTLVLCLVVSFFGIDVWMISLPFAVCKFLFDIGWDSYRLARNIPIRLPEAEEEAGNESDGASIPEKLEHSRHASPIDLEARSDLGPFCDSTVVDSRLGTPMTDLKTFSMEDLEGAQTPSRRYDSQSIVPVEYADSALSTHSQVQTGSNTPPKPVIDSRAGVSKAALETDSDVSALGDDAEGAKTLSHRPDSKSIVPVEYANSALSTHSQVQTGSDTSRESVIDTRAGVPKTALEADSDDSAPGDDAEGAQRPSRRYDSQSSVPVEYADPALSTHSRVQTGPNAPPEPVIDPWAGVPKMALAGTDQVEHSRPASPTHLQVRTGSILSSKLTAVDSKPDTPKMEHNIDPMANTHLYPASEAETRDGVEGAQMPSRRLDFQRIDHEPTPTSNLSRCRSHMDDLQVRLFKRFPTVMTAFPRLPFGLVPFAFSQFILIEALNHQGWVNIWGDWLVRASHKQVHPTIWLIGVLGVILCNISGTNVGATILLTKVVRAAALPYDANRAAAIALAIASNVGAVSFTFSASLAGLLWKTILTQKGVDVKQMTFAFWNLLPIFVLTTVGLGVVSAEMAVLFPS